MFAGAKRAWRGWSTEHRLYSGQPLNGPRWVQVGIADGCNYRCSWCRTHSHLLPRPNAAAMLSRPRFEELVEDLKLLGTSLVEFSGLGEPLLHPEAISMVRRVKQAGRHALLITNGSRLTHEICQELVELGLDNLNLSLNAATEATHVRLHHAPRGDHARILRMLQYLRRLRDSAALPGPLISVSMVVEKENYQEIPRLTSQAARAGADFVYFAPLGVNTASLQLVMTREEDARARELVVEADARARAWGMQTNAAAFLDRPIESHWTKQLLSQVPCYIGQIYARVQANGEVYPCAASLRRSLGNLRIARFREIWRSAEYRRFRQEAMALPQSRSTVAGCQCWTCGQHFLIKEYHSRVQRKGLGQVSDAAA